MDIHKVATIVKERFLEQGTFLPSVFIELDNTEVEVLVIPELKEGSSTPERARILFDAGRKCGHETEKAQQGVTGLYLASISWAQDKEGVLVAKMGEGKGLDHMTYFYEVLRGGNGIVDLLEDPLLSGKETISPLLPAFMMGVVTVRTHQSVSVARRMLPALLSEYERITSLMNLFGDPDMQE